LIFFEIVDRSSAYSLRGKKLHVQSGCKANQDAQPAKVVQTLEKDKFQIRNGSYQCTVASPSILFYVFLGALSHLSGCGVLVVKGSAIAFFPQVPHGIDCHSIEVAPLFFWD
jgi:hypothetical protein